MLFYSLHQLLWSKNIQRTSLDSPILFRRKGFSAYSISIHDNDLSINVLTHKFLKVASSIGSSPLLLFFVSFSAGSAKTLIGSAPFVESTILRVFDSLSISICTYVYTLGAHMTGSSNSKRAKVASSPKSFLGSRKRPPRFTLHLRIKSNELSR